MKSKNILLTNDDGYQARGLLELAEALSADFHVYIVAPDRERSASSRSMTLSSALKVRSENAPSFLSGYFSVSGMPVDCVKIALHKILAEKINLTVSGINRGINTGIDLHYSGTAGAAMESYLMGIPAVSVSLDNDSHEASYKQAALIASSTIKKILSAGSEYFIYNINIPNLPESSIKGIRSVRMNRFFYRENYREVRDENGEISYWLDGYRADGEKAIDTDLVSLKEGFVTITPLSWDMTDYSMLEKIRGYFDETHGKA